MTESSGDESALLEESLIGRPGPITNREHRFGLVR